LFLDEIATASLAVREKILRVIEYGSFERVGGNEVHHVDVRVIAATNADLPALAAGGPFPQRPSRPVGLRRRYPSADARARRGHSAAGRAFRARHDARIGPRVFQGFTATALARLSEYRWPGNVRELKNVVERSLYRWPRPDAPIDDVVFDAFGSPHRPAAPLPEPPALPAVGPAAPGDFLGRVAAYEHRLLSEALMANHFNQRRTAAALGLTYDQLRHHLKKHALTARR
jgi:psp operon transcriptional activator